MMFEVEASNQHSPPPDSWDAILRLVGDTVGPSMYDSLALREVRSVTV